MPQMAPISWLILFIVFSLSFILFNIINYFCFFKAPNFNDENNTTTKNSIFMNWKW